VKFLIDANLPPALARWLASEGHEAHHVGDLGLEGMADRAIWQRARDMDACIVTKDEDFVLLQALDRAGPAVVWVRIGNAVRSVLLQRLPELWPAVVAATARHTISTRSDRLTILAARCNVFSVTLPSFGSSNRRTCERLVFIRCARPFCEMLPAFIASAICQARTSLTATAANSSRLPSPARKSSSVPSCVALRGLLDFFFIADSLRP
jgi:predicted nuclease of predicted toxin-antitoxin system